jgi:hypothetical protein
VDKIAVVIGSINGNDLIKEHDGDDWYISDGILHITSEQDGLMVSYPAGAWYRVERMK